MSGKNSKYACLYNSMNAWNGCNVHRLPYYLISFTKAPEVENVGSEEKEESEIAEGVTMLDVLQDENDMEEDAR